MRTGTVVQADQAVDLRVVESLVVEMFSAVADAVRAASAAFLSGDRDAARRIVAADCHVDELLTRVDTLAEAGLIGHDELSRDDRRLLIYVLRTAPELERSADLIEHVALRTPQGLVAQLPPAVTALLAEMAEIAARMWRRTADAFVDRDGTVGATVQRQDELLDDLHVELTEAIAASGCSPAVAVEIGLVARFYERLGDHAVNVAHRVTSLGPLPAEPSVA